MAWRHRSHRQYRQQPETNPWAPLKTEWRLAKISAIKSTNQSSTKPLHSPINEYRYFKPYSKGMIRQWQPTGHFRDVFWADEFTLGFDVIGVVVIQANERGFKGILSGKIRSEFLTSHLSKAPKDQGNWRFLKTPTRGRWMWSFHKANEWVKLAADREAPWRKTIEKRRCSGWAFQFTQQISPTKRAHYLLENASAEKRHPDLKHCK